MTHHDFEQIMEALRICIMGRRTFAIGGFIIFNLRAVTALGTGYHVGQSNSFASTDKKRLTLRSMVNPIAGQIVNISLLSRSCRYSGTVRHGFLVLTGIFHSLCAVWRSGLARLQKSLHKFRLVRSGQYRAVIAWQLTRHAAVCLELTVGQSGALRDDICRQCLLS